MNVIGITSGVGSLQYGFQKHGFKVGISHEWRKYYNIHNTFEKNFHQTCYPEYDVERSFTGVDCIVSHPECGNYSNLYTGKLRDTRQADPGDIWKFIDLAKQYKPKTFLVDNLPKSLLAVSKDEWKKAFRNYRIYFEYVSNWGYGNIQKNRNRLFIIGVHKDLDFVFRPQERAHESTIRDVLEGLKPGTPNHQKMTLKDNCKWKNYQIGIFGKNETKELSLAQFQPWLKKCKLNNNIPYYNLQQELKSKPGYAVVDIDKYAPVLSGGGGFYDNHYIFDEEEKYIRPLTIRERARIQGFDDDFIFYPTEFEFGSKDHQSLIKQTGKCMPVNFPGEFARQLKNYIANGTLEETESRLLKQL